VRPNIVSEEAELPVSQEQKLVTTTDSDVEHQLPLDKAPPGLPTLKPAYELETPDVLTSKLSNGLRVASQETYGQAVTLGMFVGTGSRHESAANNGSTHLFEHMAFKGTKSRSHASLVKEIEDMGAMVNACAAREHLVFSVDVLRDDLEQAIQLLAESLLEPTITAEELEHQKLIVNFGREELEQNPQMLVTEEIHSAAYGEETPLGQPLFCPEHNFDLITPESLTNYMDSHFHAGQMVLAAAGVEHEEFTKLAEKYLADIPAFAPASATPGE
jgi:processing peptidase subunit alpha